MTRWCPKCGANTKVIDVRDHDLGARRRRECIDCHCRYTTIEIPVGSIRSATKAKAEVEHIMNRLGI